MDIENVDVLFVPSSTRRVGDGLKGLDKGYR